MPTRTYDGSGVDSLLDRLGLGGFDWTTAEATSGRNDNWLGRTAGGRRIFVKTIVGSAVEVAHCVRRTAAFYRIHTGAPPSALRTTTLLGQDEQAAIQVFDCLDGARDGRELARDGAFDQELGAQAGAAVGALHAVRPARLAELEESLPPLPRQYSLSALSAEVFYEASAAQLEAWRLLQPDPGVTRALTALERESEEAPRVPVHGDVCLDQFLIADGTLHLIDWEAFGLGDPARDVGDFLGEWLHHVVLGFLGDRAGNGSGRAVPVPTIALTPNWRPWRAARPTVEAFWDAYRTAQPVLSAGLAPRAVRYACRHLLLRMLTDAQFRPRLDGSGHTLFRLAKTILAAPERFTTILGLEG
ncbi:class V lanthionine synthetase subunit LxmK [Amycolatopsis sacchari]|uniref:Phosphotransferase enzyme family protein n=1 Tax=Amycolatopsis sacchari TaxID=115433 RepID=A0A1I4DK76_9PSEU|nr:class V lanthionine synthetase subunit LxmK [Amycolatopsis sacchari]SFK92281.1 Phosphotransferase enzyme family protein [Amycolatopsis sacchari]